MHFFHIVFNIPCLELSRQRTIQKIIYTNFKFLIIGIWQNSNVKLSTSECGPNHVNLRIGQCWLCNFGKEETSTWAMWTSQFGKVELANMKIQLCKNLNIWYFITILPQQFKSPFLLTLSIVNFSTKKISLVAHYSIWRRTITFGGEKEKIHQSFGNIGTLTYMDFDANLKKE